MPDATIDAFIAGLPKAELHLHIEGSLEPEAMFAIGKRNKVTLPFKSVDEVRAAYAFSRLQDFLDIYYAGAQVLLHEQDFFDLGIAYFRRAAADNVRHAEIFFDPQTHTDRGVPFAVVADGLLRAMAVAERDLGVSSKLILCFLRHLDEDAAFATLRMAEPYVDRIAGVGLDSSEVGHPPSKFAGVFKAAGERGLHLTAHAGEEGPPAYVYEALDLLKVGRIDHGNRALEDDVLTRRLVAEGKTLTVCPLSNLKLCVVHDMVQHPLKRMLDLGLKATINSDDPAYFGGYVNDNFRAVAHGLGLTRADFATLARNSFTGSWLGAAEISKNLAALDAYIEGGGVSG
ncbi:Adenine deaminase [Alphaproteobacteria bacterium SO-S41]|nr:Adenine deaminase [Alphaproteobacteria bacterium SO-S41]